MSKVYLGLSAQDVNNLTSGIYGGIPIISGAGVKVADCHGLETFEATTITEFKDENGQVVVTGWEGFPIPADKIVYFGEKISKYTVSAGGLGQALKYKP